MLLRCYKAHITLDTNNALLQLQRLVKKNHDQLFSNQTINLGIFFYVMQITGRGFGRVKNSPAGQQAVVASIRLRRYTLYIIFQR
jgi:hypothetical protein